MSVIARLDSAQQMDKCTGMADRVVWTRVFRPAMLRSPAFQRALGRRREESRTEEKMSRIGVAACCLLMLLVLSAQQQQVDGLSKFCRCYRNCYTDYRKTSGRYPCNANCFEDCINRMLPPAAPTTVPVDCRHICLMGFCGSMEIADGAMAGDAEACVADCTKNLIGASAPSAAKINN